MLQPCAGIVISSLCLAVVPAAVAAPPAESFVNGTDVVPLIVDAGAIGVLFDAAVDPVAARARLAQLPFVAPAAAWGAPYVPGHLVRVPTLPGAAPERVQEALRALGAEPGVRAAGPRFLAGSEPYFVTDEVLVRWRPDVDPAAAAALASAHDLEAVGTLAYSENPGVVYRLPPGASLDAPAITRALVASGLVEFALPDFSLTRVPYATTTDPLFANQWHLHSTGQSGAKVDADVDAPEAWDVTRGDPALKIAVIDTGVELAHPDLVANLIAGTDVLGNDSVPQAEDFLFGLFPENHSTAVCGIAAGAGNNGAGTSGAAQHCRIIPIRFLSEFFLIQPTVQDEADAFIFARAAGADVINNSWGPLGAAAIPAATKAAIQDAVVNGRNGKGIVIFFAAGNSTADTTGNEYVTDPRTLAVSASTDQDLLASYSNFGAAIDFCAPSNGGVTNGTATTDRLGSVGYSSGDYTDAFGGTSSASPLAAGVALLVLSANPNLTWQEVGAILRDTAVKIDPAGGGYDGSGHSTKYGYGRVNAAAAVAAAAPTGIEFYGAGHPGSGGKVPQIGATGGTPAVGNAAFAVTLADARANVTAGFFLGFARANLPFAGGTLLVAPSPAVLLTLPTGPTGSITLGLPLPPDPGLAAFQFDCQWIVDDAGAAGGYALSAGMEVTIQP